MFFAALACCRQAEAVSAQLHGKRSVETRASSFHRYEAQQASQGRWLCLSASRSAEHGKAARAAAR